MMIKWLLIHEFQLYFMRILEMFVVCAWLPLVIQITCAFKFSYSLTKLIHVCCVSSRHRTSLLVSISRDSKVLFPLWIALPHLFVFSICFYLWGLYSQLVNSFSIKETALCFYRWGFGIHPHHPLFVLHAVWEWLL